MPETVEHTGSVSSVKQPLFSVVIPVFNKEPHIRRCMESIRHQQFSNFEVVVVDDACTDDSIREVRKYADGRTRILHRETPGPGGYAARNLGIKMAKAEWIAFLDADDEWYPDHLQKMVRVMEKFPHAEVLGAGRTFSLKDREVGIEAYYLKHEAGRGSHFLDLDGYLEAYISGLRPLWTSVACIRKSILQRAGGFPDGKSMRGGDIDTWLRCVATSGGMAWSAHIGARYHKDSINMATKANLNTAEAECETVRNLLKNHRGKTAKLLKLFANNRIMKAFKEESKVNGVIRLRYLKNLYLGVMPWYLQRKS